MAFDKNHTSTAQKVVIIFFAVILVASLCLPFFSSCSAPAGQGQGDAAGNTADDVSAPVSATTVAGVRSKYSSVISSLESKLEADPQNTTAMASLGNNYMDMASELSQASDAADNPEAANDAYAKAIEYYDAYLGLADSSAVRVDRAVCLFYSDHADEAIADLTAFVEGDGADFAMAWFNLGVMHYSQGDYEASIEEFQKAVDLDADGSMGVAGTAAFYQSFAQAMIDAQAQEQDGADEQGQGQQAEPAQDAQDEGGSDAASAAQDK